MDYERAKRYILEIPLFTGKNQMQNTKAFLRFLLGALGYGMDAFAGKVIHVAGTNGKGSVCAYLESMLRQAGYQTGLFTSPHLVTPRERIRLAGAMISREDFARVFSCVLKKAQEFADREENSYHPAFFEILFFMAAVYFLENKTDYMIMETGLGGRLDATNALPAPAVTVLTKIGLDHTQYLGDTPAQIAAEKAAIIKEGTRLVYWEDGKETADVIKAFARQNSVQPLGVSQQDIHDLKFHKKCIDFSIESSYYNTTRIILPDSAIYQARNAALAFYALEALDGGKIPKGQLVRGLARMRWEGRMEEILPGIFLDGAHNEDGILAFLETVGQDKCKGRRILLFGVMKDKHYRKMIRHLAKSRLFACILLTRIDNERTLEETCLSGGFTEETGEEPLYFRHTADAFSCAIEQKGDNDNVYIAGSLYLAGEIKALLRRNVSDKF